MNVPALASTLDGHHGQSVLRGTTDAAVRVHQAIFDALCCLVAVRLEEFLLGLRLGNDGLELRLLGLEVELGAG